MGLETQPGVDGLSGPFYATSPAASRVETRSKPPPTTSTVRRENADAMPSHP